ncbi:uncharacterized protein EDB93DRAFT_1101291 [Suillus bovinus]|uniref:uncharacterized protein n=1 Tax=Suillus bovinus TaxID=48563 RepID=UPI001B86D47E|nr:uncharacterized protein EDB93DRAFT_1101291 [Suillus bovinus]KAG2156875.1 hypothetical protein EDB93DRAFT_1101291 [Suillus bovinus]
MSFNANSPESHQSKADLQRQYRENQGEGFAELQQAIRDVTDGRVDPAKRHEILIAGMQSFLLIFDQLTHDTPAAQKIREFSRLNEELRRQLNSMLQSQSSWGAQGPYAPVNFSTAQYSNQYYPDHAAQSDPNFFGGYPG